VIISLGITYTQFAILPTDSSSTNNSASSEIQTWANSVRESGQTLIKLGSIWVIVGMVFFIILTLIDKSKSKSNKSRKVVLFDEMYDGKDIELGQRGYDAYSVKKLRLTGEPLQYDYSVLKYLEENKMILITEDPENYGGCQENNLPCIKLGQNPSIEEIIKAIESLKDA
jgi:hypothetical protein